jgi:hypothetical protein
MSKIDVCIGVGGLAAGLIAIGYAIGTHSKMARVSKTLDCSIDDLAKNTNVDIPEAMVKRAVERAVESEAARAVTRATHMAVQEIKADIHKQVTTAVEKEYDRIKDSVLREITDEASKISVDRVRAEVESEAKKKALEKFDVSLDGILTNFNDNLKNTSKIYSSIANSITKQNDGKEFVFKVG